MNNEHYLLVLSILLWGRLVFGVCSSSLLFIVIVDGGGGVWITMIMTSIMLKEGRNLFDTSYLMLVWLMILHDVFRISCDKNIHTYIHDHSPLWLLLQLRQYITITIMIMIVSHSNMYYYFSFIYYDRHSLQYQPSPHTLPSSPHPHPQPPFPHAVSMPKKKNVSVTVTTCVNSKKEVKYHVKKWCVNFNPMKQEL